ncbi:MAG: hypothetical protein ABJB73_08190 [Candidatus Nitrosocosmicus sp.]
MGCSWSGYSGYSSSSIYQGARGFFTRQEKIELLKEYQKDLEKEVQGVSERIKELEAI